ncbi:uncharacterized protein YjgD (DUF1641 family) [Catalinimonas alkaloidigena]|uniref:DUF1641 domain-containing protein n=1 Tax=Catalinimonas alkaloidigena TaxID=1075417 RepID=UPI00240634F2|nr:DUF1641 domain-containing protein [Catalinimonas alkaloidigena]MDF9797563.1 uncharacterized protein YjgD (DUF1641 family) [Catalinimonas alkaloidigena]
MNNSHKIQTEKNGKAAVQNLNEEQNEKVLNDILQQLDSIRSSVEQLSTGMKQAPEVMEIATDAIDNLAIKARTRGIDIEQRGEMALHLMERLSQPKTMNKLNALLDLTEQLPDFVEDAVNVVDETMDEAHRSGIDVMQRSKEMLHLLKRLSSPKMVEQLNALLDFAEQGTDMVGLGADAIDDSMNKLHAQGFDVYTALENGQKMLVAANTALHETLEESPKKIGGVFALLRQLNDKDFQKVLAFLTTFGKHFGKQLGK